METSINHLKNTVKSSIAKVSSIPEETINKWRIGRKNFP